MTALTMMETVSPTARNLNVGSLLPVCHLVVSKENLAAFSNRAVRAFFVSTAPVASASSRHARMVVLGVVPWADVSEQVVKVPF